ncbi:unnamed protein product, partial [Adineta ricciae]
MSDPKKKIEGEIDRFDDVFHGHGDDINVKEDENIDYDQFFSDFHKNDDTNMENIDYEQFFTEFYSNEEAKMVTSDYEEFFTEFYSNEENRKKETIPTQDLTTEEQHLSQKLSQLSAADEQQNQRNESTTATTEKKRPPLTPSTPIAPAKKLKGDIIEQTCASSGSSGDVMPEYLSESNQTFATIIDPVLQTSASAIHIGDLQQIALL